MANSWLRLWHDMPNDPKWRSIARASKQGISEVMAVYLHLLVNASNATERGRTQNVCSEDIASALDIETEQVDAIIEAMQGRVLDGDMVTGWSKRQVEREDGAAERAKRWREAKKEAKQTQPNATERKQTPDKDKDKDKDKEEKPKAMSGSPSANADDAQLEKQKTNKQTIADARTVLAYLNKNAGKNFRDVDSTLGPIVARLKEGYTPERLREIAHLKIEQWGTDEKMAEYLRPATLYNATKCAQYDGELGS